MSFGLTIVYCYRCDKQFSLYGYLPVQKQIWDLDEGLECCDKQTEIIAQVEKEEEE